MKYLTIRIPVADADATAKTLRETDGRVINVTVTGKDIRWNFTALSSDMKLEDQPQ